MWETSRPLSFAVAAYAIAASVLPNLVLIAAGHLVGEIPAAARDGLSSARAKPREPPGRDSRLATAARIAFRPAPRGTLSET